MDDNRLAQQLQAIALKAEARAYDYGITDLTGHE